MSASRSSTVLTLSAYGQRLEVLPFLGGAISRYARYEHGQWYEFLRPASQEAIDTACIEGMSSFLMAPWAGRIKNGRFVYEGRSIDCLHENRSSSCIHGFVREQAWRIEKQKEHDLCLSFQHQASESWPFSFVIKQRYQLHEQGLLISVDVENTGTEKMPFSLGHHPFFPCDEKTKLFVNAKRAWYNDDELMPIYLASHPLNTYLSKGYLVHQGAWDIILTDWDREVRIEWQDRTLSYEVSSPMDFFVLYRPSGVDWFCAEPFGNITNSFNLREQFLPQEIGGVDLLAGEKLQSTFSLKTSIKL